MSVKIIDSAVFVYADGSAFLIPTADQRVIALSASEAIELALAILKTVTEA